MASCDNEDGRLSSPSSDSSGRWLELHNGNNVCDFAAKPSGSESEEKQGHVTPFGQESPRFTPRFDDPLPSRGTVVREC